MTDISLIERGHSVNRTLETLVKLSRALGVLPAQALSWHRPRRRAATTTHPGAEATEPLRG